MESTPPPSSTGHGIGYEPEPTAEQPRAPAFPIPVNLPQGYRVLQLYFRTVLLTQLGNHLNERPLHRLHINHFERNPREIEVLTLLADNAIKDMQLELNFVPCHLCRTYHQI